MIPTWVNQLGGAGPVDDWILATGFWNDLGFWRDDAFWID